MLDVSQKDRCLMRTHPVRCLVVVLRCLVSKGPLRRGRFIPDRLILMGSLLYWRGVILNRPKKKFDHQLTYFQLTVLPSKHWSRRIEKCPCSGSFEGGKEFTK